MQCDMRASIGISQIYLRPALIPCEQARCSFKERWRSTGCFLHFRSRGRTVALHVNLCIHHMFPASLGSKVEVI